MTPSIGESRTLRPGWWFAVFSFAIIIWSVGIFRPVDLPNWHEFDYSSIARNFVREGGNIFFPRIDWRGDGPGFTEMEFPIIPWIMSQLYRVFGIHEIIGRILSLISAVGALWVFRKIALKVLSQSAALVSTLFVAVSHEMNIVATAILPEALMLLCYLLALYFFIDWYQRKNWSSYVLAIFSFALATLVKSPAAHLAIFFLIWAVANDGMKAFRRTSLYLFAVLSFAPAVVWYSHARSLWQHFHNSMGVSNEDHWLGLDMLRRPKVLANLVTIEFVYVFGCGAVLLVLVSIISSRLKTPVNRLALSWLAAVCIYLLVILRTAGANWAAYYHVVAVPPVALLFAAGISLVRSNLIWSNFLSIWRPLAPWVVAVAVLFGSGILMLESRDTAHLPGVAQDMAAAHSGIPTLLVLAVLAGGVTVLCFSVLGLQDRTERPSGSFFATTLVIACFTYFLVSGQLLIGVWTTYETRTPEFEAASYFRNILQGSGLIVATGGICRDPGGHRVASDAPEMFYWLDRKGFTTCEGLETITELESYRRRGARYFIAEKNSLNEEHEFQSELLKSYSLVADWKSSLLFRLDSRPAAAALPKH